MIGCTAVIFAKNVDFCRIACYNFTYKLQAFMKRFHIIIIMWNFYSAPQKPEFLYLPAADIAAFYCISAGGVYGRMSQNIGKADDILLQAVIGSRKQMAEVMRKNFIF